jgi:hypothetical protein
MLGMDALGMSALAVVILLCLARASLLHAIVAAKPLTRCDRAGAIGMRALRYYSDVACRFGL